ncbi:uncharacterized protein LOC108624159 [Ceratina calcarata]|uniref:Uncharacterized protein LOC108624159 n=1 Tax=Ceratina calcarata TaxID=156304 RepID=A0AAJ7N5M8_9HYME|nr:uncharacterized protein LOC108624159 [Ceratina calcarata]
MKYKLSVLFYNKCRSTIFQECRRYAGHSKWQNIKHTKETQDAARSALFRSVLSKMKAVILESGNSDPNSNPKLATLVDHAKKINMPAATLKTYLEKFQKPESGQTHILTAKTSSGVLLILHVESNNLITTKLNIQHILKRFSTKSVDLSVLSMFDCITYITVSKDCTFDQAMEDAIAVDAEDVKEVKEDNVTCFKFRSEFLFPNKVASQLANLGYNILSTENVCVPTTTIELADDELSKIDRLKQKLTTDVKEIRKIEDNIAQ